MNFSRKSPSTASPSESGECPICHRHFQEANLAMHVEFCLRPGANVGKKKSDAAASFFAPAKSSVPMEFRPASGSQKKTPAKRTLEATVVDETQETEEKRPSPKRQRSNDGAAIPLAERMRPTTLDDLVGQEELLGDGKPLSFLIQRDKVPSMILWGPPGCGKTTLAHVISKRTGCRFISLSGATSKASDMKDAVEKARGEKKLLGRHTIVFVDEIHRFNKNQQDFFLPVVEDGTITLIGATTENPSFEVNNALLSRCRVYTLQQHTPASIQSILERAIANPESSGLTSGAKDVSTIEAEPSALQYLAEQCGGDARVALNCLEMAVQTSSPEESDKVCISLEHVQRCFAKRQTLYYDKDGDYHYDYISAFHKSIRGSDANAALYWMARMLEGGEEPLYVARRMIRIASEDVGLAAPEMLSHAVAAHQAAHFIGMPECDVVLAQCATMLARAPKSVEVYKAYGRVKQSIKEWTGGPMPQVPLHLRNAPTKLMESLDYGKDYKYNPDYTEEEVKDQTYLPKELVGTDFFAKK